ncbi:hypothetical protein F66182_2064 [Fusarium sp. NRRL 66182]|nr:hypothetical protein F66182_2064 [Fusarium sp. NRRL 66182]
MPSHKVFAAVLAALAVVDASPCKPKPATTSGSTEAILTTTGTETAGTATTETVATTTSAAACSHYTPYTEIVPADCGKKGVAPSCADKIIGDRLVVKDYADCGNKCGKTIGCKSFSFDSASCDAQQASCTLYKALVGELGFYENSGRNAEAFYDLELCFGCGEESSTTIETSVATTETESAATTGTETTGQTTNTETANTETANTETANTETANTETTAATGTTETVNTETTNTETATGTTETVNTETANTETTATAGTTETVTSETINTETTTATGTTETETATTETETATTETATTETVNTETTATTGTTETDTATTETSETETLTANTDTTTTSTAAATTTTEASCTAYTKVPEAPVEKCGKKGKAGSGAAAYKIGSFTTISSSDECASRCSTYTQDGAVCVSFSYTATGGDCHLYSVPVAELDVEDCQPGETEYEYYDFETCYSCKEEDGSTTSDTTTAAPTTTDTTTAIPTTTDTTTTAPVADTTTDTTTTAPVTDTTTTAPVTDTTTTAPVTDTTTTAPVTDTTTTAPITDTTTAAPTTTTEAVCTAYTKIPEAPEDCGKKGRIEPTDNLIDSFESSSIDECALSCDIWVGGAPCVAFSFTPANNVCTLFSGLINELNIQECQEGETESEYYDFGSCYACDHDGVATTETATTTSEAATTTTSEATTTTEAATTTTSEAAPVCTSYVPLQNPPSSCGTQGKVNCGPSAKLGPSTIVSSSEECGSLCGSSTQGCKTFSYKPKSRISGGWCQLYNAPLESLSFTPYSTNVKFYDLDTCYTCSDDETPVEPPTCPAYVPDFASCARDTHCGTPGSICKETKIPGSGDNSCVENCAKSCIEHGDCKYFSYKPATFSSAAKCKLYSAGEVVKDRRSSTKFYEPQCFKCQN